MVVPGMSAAWVSQLLGRDLAGERPLSDDPAERHVVVADEFFVTWMTAPVPAPHSGVELLEYLTAQGFEGVPTFVGALEHDDHVVATVHRFVADASDGRRWIAGAPDGAALGSTTAALHTALAGLRRSAIAARSYRAHAVDDLHHLERFSDGDDANTVAAISPTVLEALDPLREDRLLPAHCVHGCLDLGHVLRHDGQLLVTGFAAGTRADVDERTLPQTPLVDLAALSQSVDHVLHSTDPAMVAATVDALVDSYGDQHSVDRPVLHSLRVAHELRAARRASGHASADLSGAIAALCRLIE